MPDYKKFDDLIFKLHSAYGYPIAKAFFDNGYGVSVAQIRCLVENEGFTLAVLKGDLSACTIDRTTPITKALLTGLPPARVTEIMQQIQELPKSNS